MMRFIYQPLEIDLAGKFSTYRKICVHIQSSHDTLPPMILDLAYTLVATKPVVNTTVSACVT